MLLLIYFKAVCFDQRWSSSGQNNYKIFIARFHYSLLIIYISVSHFLNNAFVGITVMTVFKIIVLVSYWYIENVLYVRYCVWLILGLCVQYQASPCAICVGQRTVGHPPVIVIRPIPTSILILRLSINKRGSPETVIQSNCLSYVEAPLDWEVLPNCFDSLAGWNTFLWNIRANWSGKCLNIVCSLYFRRIFPDYCWFTYLLYGAESFLRS